MYCTCTAITIPSNSNGICIVHVLPITTPSNSNGIFTVHVLPITTQWNMYCAFTPITTPSNSNVSDFDQMMQKRKEAMSKARRRRKKDVYITANDDHIAAMLRQMKQAAEVFVGPFSLPSFSSSSHSGIPPPPPPHAHTHTHPNKGPCCIFLKQKDLTNKLMKIYEW